MNQVQGTLDENKARKKTYAAQYRADNITAIKSRVNARSRKPENRAKKLAYMAKYMAKPENKERRKAYLEKHMSKPESKEKKQAYMKKYSASPESRARENAWKKKWRKTTEGRAMTGARNRARRAAKLGASVRNQKTISAWEKAWRKARRVVCYWCNKRVPAKGAHVDHINPLSKGGDHSIENLCISCPLCNCTKNSHIISEWNKKLVSPVLL
jgi:5-methylcytosine-specific restriction endonuclease McrA